MRHSLLVLLVLVVTLAFTSPLLAVEATLPRHPAPSPDGSTIAFSWQGDLWLVPAEGGGARRLTAHAAAERFPVWSHDGTMLAFTSDRHGNDDVFVMPADGSAPPKRLTFASVDDLPTDFTPDGSAVLFSSGRAEGIRWMPQLWTVPVTGGTPALAQDAFGEAAVFSSDGSALVFVRGATKWTRRGYRGAANRELWLRTADDEYVQLTEFDGDDDRPSWIDGHSLAFLSARSGRKNVFRFNLVTGEAQALTAHQGSDVRFPRASVNGGIVAYEFEDAIWTVAPAGGEPRRLSIDVPADELLNPVERRTDTDGAEDLVISPDGKLAAFIVHGELFVTEIRSKDDQEISAPPTVRVTRTPAREQQPVWTPDGDAILFASDRDGSFDLFRVAPADPEAGWIGSFEFVTETVVATPAEENRPRLSPDGAQLAWLEGRGRLMVRPLAGGEPWALVEHWDEVDWRWSPDGRWIACSIEDQWANSEIWILAADGSRRFNVSRHPHFDVAPEWSPDGRRLVWLSRRHDRTFDVWSVWLTRADHERTAEQWLAEWQAKDEKGKKGGEAKGDEDEKNGDEGDEKKPEPPTVAIDFDRLWERATPLTSMLGDEGRAQVSPDGKRVVFTAVQEDETDLYSVRFDGEDLKRLTTGGEDPSSVQFDDTGKTLFYLDDDGRIKRVGLDGKAGDPAPFAARYEIDRRAEREVVVDETWRALNQHFYDPDFHGVDWPTRLATYRPWALAASHPADFADVMNLMLGELNASHMGYYPPGTRGGPPRPGDRTGFLGVTFDPAAGGPGLLVGAVVPDSPAARVDVGLVPGDRLLAVDGARITETTNVFELLADTVGRRLAIDVRRAGGREERLAVEPIDYSSYDQLRYEEWVRERRRLVETWSDGRLGYIHIQGMSIPSFEEFERGLHAAADGKEGLIIDVRSNGGGWTTDYLMSVLMVQRHAWTVPRDAPADVKAYPTAERLPLAAWTRPAAALCNEDSYSNAEIFSHAFKTLDRGPLVGSPTFGAVISTGGTRLLDGALVRLPGRGWFVAADGTNMENHGAVPNVLVWQPPTEDASATADTQLQKTVEVLLADLETDPRRGAW